LEGLLKIGAVFVQIHREIKGLLNIQDKHPVVKVLRKFILLQLSCLNFNKLPLFIKGMAGGKSWTENWLQFDNSYYKRYLNPNDPELLWLPSDQALFDCIEFRPLLLKYANDEQTFFQDYAISHKKMSELGSRFYPDGGFELTD